MPSNIPQTPEEAAYIAYALLNAFGNMLIDKGIVSEKDVDAVFEDAAAGLSQTPNSASQRGSGFIRKIRIVKD